MDFHTAAQLAVREVAASHDPDAMPVHVALRLAIRAWQLCEQPETIRVHWDLFGTGVQAAIDTLTPPAAAATILLDEQQLPDTEAVRREAAALVAAVADRLEKGAGDGRADAGRRWAWSVAAARLYAAADDLVSWS